MTVPLTPAELDRLRNICARLGSDFDGERAAAGLLATRLLKDKGLSWCDVVMPTPPAPYRPATEHTTRRDLPWRQTVRDLLAQPGSLRAWEKNEFLPSLLGFQKLSPKQRNVLDQIAARVLGGPRDGHRPHAIHKNWRRSTD
jgi:hypothetical protein